MYLTHGSPIKSVRNYYVCTPDTDYMLNQSPFWESVNEYERIIPRERLVTLGMPRNDALLSGKADKEKLFGNRFKKVVVWYPTFRQHKSHTKTFQYQAGISIPVIHNIEAAKRINEIAARYDVLLVVKPHPAQDLALNKRCHWSI